jgi:hypothetical protein
MKSPRTKNVLERDGLTNQLKVKSRSRRARLEGLSDATMLSPTGRNDLLPQLEVEYRPISEIRASPRKLRKLDRAHIRAIANSIAELGFCAPILIGIDNEIVDGESRFEAAMLLGSDQIPCIRIQHLSKADLRILRLAMNRLGEKGQWNLDELKVELEELVVLDAPIELSGFTLDEIDHISLDDHPDAIELGPLAPEAGAVAIARLCDV